MHENVLVGISSLKKCLQNFFQDSCQTTMVRYTGKYYDIFLSLNISSNKNYPPLTISLHFNIWQFGWHLHGMAHLSNYNVLPWEYWFYILYPCEMGICISFNLLILYIQLCNYLLLHRLRAQCTYSHADMRIFLPDHSSRPLWCEEECSDIWNKIN